VFLLNSSAQLRSQAFPPAHPKFSSW